MPFAIADEGAPMKGVKRSEPVQQRSKLEELRRIRLRQMIDEVEAKQERDQESDHLRMRDWVVSRGLIAIGLVIWIILMSWIGIQSFKKKEPRAEISITIVERC